MTAASSWRVTTGGRSPTWDCEEFVQDNHSFSVRNTLRGLHYQIRQPQGKLVRAIVGTILDVAVDLRRELPLHSEKQKLFYCPKKTAHRVDSNWVWSRLSRRLGNSTLDVQRLPGSTPLPTSAQSHGTSRLRIDWQLDAPPIFRKKKTRSAVFATRKSSNRMRISSSAPPECLDKPCIDSC